MLSEEQKNESKIETGADATNANKEICAASPGTRVLIVAPSLSILGGQAVQAARLVERLREEKSLEVGFLSINPRLPFGFHVLQKIKYVRTVVTSIFYILSLFARVWRYDVIHVFSASYFSFVLAPTPAILIAKLYGKKVLLNYHSGEAEDHLAHWRRTAIPTLRLCDSIVVPSRYLVEVFARFNLRAEAVFNINDAARFRFREREVLRPRFLSNRNFAPHYNVGAILRAFALIQERFPEAELMVAGDGEQREELNNLARELNLQNTSFVGLTPHEQMPELYDRADIYLNASEIDNMPLSILEAYESGLPVVTTDAGGIPFIVEHERTGLIVKRGDVKALAGEAIRLLEDNKLAQKIIRKAYAECGKYTWAATRESWLAIYHELSSERLSGNTRRAAEEITSAGRKQTEAITER